MTVKNFYTANTAKPGDVFLVVIKAMVQYDGTYRLYRCPYNGDDIPQGDRIYNDIDNDMGEAIFPILVVSNGQDPTG
jgi:hypothetical protein